MTAKRTIDWERVEVEFRTGAFSNRQLADKFGCTEGAVRSRAKRYGWQKDLREAVHKATADKLLRSDVRTSNACVDAEIVNEVADVRASIVLRHRGSVGRDSARLEKLAEKFDTLMGEVADLKGLESAQGVLESMARTRARLIPLERQAFSLDDKGGDDIGNLSRDEAEAELARLRAAQGA